MTKKDHHTGVITGFIMPRAAAGAFRLREGGQGRTREILKDFQRVFYRPTATPFTKTLQKETALRCFHCMAHARRKFDEAADNAKGQAEYAITEIRTVRCLSEL